MPRAPLNGRRSLLPVAVLAAVALATPAAADVTVPASGLAHAAGATVVRDDASSSGRALKLATTRSVTTTLSLSAAARTITVRARGIACAGAPTLRVAVDGGRAVTKTLTSGKYQDLTAGTALTAGSHRVAVSLTKAYKSRSCRRAIVVDQIRAADAAPAPALAASPASVIASVTATPSEPTLTTTTPVDPTPLPTPITPTVTTPSAPAPTPTPTVTTPTTTTPAPTVTTPATTATPPVDPTPTPPVDTRPKLRWAPPALTSPTTINVPQGDQAVGLDATKDYIVDLGSTTHVGAVNISGGRNVVIIGGSITMTPLSSKVAALNIRNSTGVVHVEGVDFVGSSGKEMDAIQIQAPAATVQVENVRAAGLLGTLSTNHSDVIQPWGGVAALRVDRLSADSNYQGIYTRPDQGAIGAVDLRHVDLAFNNAAATSSGGFLLWMTNGCDMAPTSLSDVYITPRTGKSVGAAVWPTTSDASCPAKLTGNKVTWPSLPVTGSVTGGAPSSGPYVPASVPGPGYTSPGYL